MSPGITGLVRYSTGTIHSSVQQQRGCITQNQADVVQAKDGPFTWTILVHNQKTFRLAQSSRIALARSNNLGYIVRNVSSVSVNGPVTSSGLIPSIDVMLFFVPNVCPFRLHWFLLWLVGMGRVGSPLATAPHMQGDTTLGRLHSVVGFIGP